MMSPDVQKIVNQQYSTNSLAMTELCDPLVVSLRLVSMVPRIRSMI